MHCHLFQTTFLLLPNLDKPEKTLARISRMKKKISVIHEIRIEKFLYTMQESH